MTHQGNSAAHEPGPSWAVPAEPGVPAGHGSPAGKRSPRSLLMAGAVLAVVAAGVVGVSGWRATHRSCVDKMVEVLNAATPAEIVGDQSRITAEAGECASWHASDAEFAEVRRQLRPEIDRALDAAANAKVEVQGRALG